LASLTTWATATLAAETTRTTSTLATTAARATTTTLRTAGLRGALVPAFWPFIDERLRCGIVIEAFGLFADKTTIDKTLQLAHIGLLIR